jgi:hypothetical protein
MPKISFPRFDGTDPHIWRDNCLEYFKLFNIQGHMWLTAATLHLEGNAAHWYRAYKLLHDVPSWDVFIQAVEQKFGSNDHRQLMSAFLQLKQQGTVQEYKIQFEELMFKILSHNPHYDEALFVEQFVKGLKKEIRGPVASQLPETVDRAVLLALVQRDIASQNKLWCPAVVARVEQPVARGEQPKQALRIGQGEFWKERQLRDYRRANGLCFKCGECYDPQHQCQQKQVGAVHALQLENNTDEISETILNLLAWQDFQETEQLQLSLNALSGANGGETI